MLFISKEIQKAPAIIAKEVAEKLNNPFFMKVEAAFLCKCIFQS